tara:strand:+ start:211 stop:456 length:246 start_codon:yes stop_codon:yes gene_type:complete
MLKKFFVFFLLLLLANCASPGSALLGPVFTGATTKSLASASVSYTTNHMVRQAHSSLKQYKENTRKVAKKITDEFKIHLSN